jgi:bifunctional N-acetylglucosamine-1-phosphate-uridyltransferase/glucosamine-1-phosphate-acetyltransferase GlmU-like protein
MKSLVIFAAGHGSRLGADVPKSLFPINGDETILNVILQRVEEFFDKIHIIIQPQYLQQFSSHTGSCMKVSYVCQDKPRGTSIALRDALPSLESGIVATLWGDQVGISSELIESTLSKFSKEKINGILLPLCWRKHPYVSFDVTGELVTDFSTSSMTRSFGYQDSGFAVSTLSIWQRLYENFDESSEDAYKRDGELNLMKMIVTGRNDVSCFSYVHYDEETTCGINTPADLEEYRRRTRVER